MNPVKKQKNIPYLGQNVVFYCKECNIPIIMQNRCPKCNKSVERIKLTPPYDIRPAMKEDIIQIKRLLRDNFGSQSDFIDLDDIILLNHVGSEEQMDEIVYQGKPIGIRRYDIIKQKWILKLNCEGLNYISDSFERNWVMVDDGAISAIRRGANVLIPGVVDFDSNIKEGDYIVVINKNKEIIAGAIARINGNEINLKNKGIFAKTYCAANKKERNDDSKIKWTWNDIAKWNEKIINQITEKALEFIQKVVSEYNLDTVVSFSGGKDSLVTLDLVYNALPKENYKVLFVDTGLEFPETVQYVNEIIEYYNLSDNYIQEESPTELFWEAFKKFGPPARDFRYCCKFAKLAPVRKALSKLNPNSKFLCFVGQRRYESYIRSKGEIWQNKYLSNQINVSPIQNWNALMIWLYIFYKKLPYNELYNQGFERIGCWLCPSSNMAHFKILQKTHPDYSKKLTLEINKWVETHKLPKLYETAGLWRFKRLPKKIMNILPKAELVKIKRPTSAFHFKGANLIESECVSEPPTIIGAFSQSVEINRIKETLKMYFNTVRTYKNQFVYASNKDDSIFIYSDGTFKLSIKEIKRLKKRIVDTIRNLSISVFRAMECTKCGLCIEECPRNAIKIQDGLLLIDEKVCIQCLECNEVCPIVTIVHKELNSIMNSINLKNDE